MGWIYGELVLVSIAAMLSPTTLSFSIFTLVVSDRPLRSGLWFYIGALGATLGIGVIAAFGGVPLTSCVRAGFADLCGYLQRAHGFSREGAYVLLGQAGRVRVGNMIDPFYSCLVEIERKYLE